MTHRSSDDEDSSSSSRRHSARESSRHSNRDSYETRPSSKRQPEASPPTQDKKNHSLIGMFGEKPVMHCLEIGAAVVAAHRLWPKGVIYGDMDEWEKKYRQKHGFYKSARLYKVDGETDDFGNPSHRDRGQRSSGRESYGRPSNGDSRYGRSSYGSPVYESSAYRGSGYGAYTYGGPSSTESPRRYARDDRDDRYQAYDYDEASRYSRRASARY